LPTGCTLSCFVSVTQDYYRSDQPYNQIGPKWTGGHVWAQNDFSAFFIEPKSMSSSTKYKMVFVLTLAANAIPQELKFTITINCQE
jgi:hypothetical protein